MVLIVWLGTKNHHVYSYVCIVVLLYLFAIGIFCGTLYHFYVHDTTGVIGTTIRFYLQPLASSLLSLLILFGGDDTTIIDKENNHEWMATVMVSLFMQVVAILQLPICFGPTFSPFVATYNFLLQFIAPFQSRPEQSPNAKSPNHNNDNNIVTTTATTTKQKNIKKKENTTKKASVSSTKDKKL